LAPNNLIELKKWKDIESRAIEASTLLNKYL